MLDVKICGGTLIDGTGDASRRADLGIREGRIVAIGAIGETETSNAIEAWGGRLVRISVSGIGDNPSSKPSLPTRLGIPSGSPGSKAPTSALVIETIGPSHSWPVTR